MLPLDQKPWAKTIAWLVIGLTMIGCALYAYHVKLTRPLDWGERAILVLLLLTVIPPNAAIIRRHGTGARR